MGEVVSRRTLGRRAGRPRVSPRHMERQGLDASVIIFGVRRVAALYLTGEVLGARLRASDMPRKSYASIQETHRLSPHLTSMSLHMM